MKACRSCGAPLTRTFLNLGNMPLANAYLDSPDDPEQVYPLHARVCDSCLLVQADEQVTPDTLFNDYAFFSGMSRPWIDHCHDFAKMARERFEPKTVLEVGSNDGTLLDEFHGCTVLGVDGAQNVAAIANERGIPTIPAFFTEELAQTLLPADLIVANNVFGHVPDPNDFARGLKAALKPDGVISIETPWLGSLVERCEFDTIYHEHFNYWSLMALRKLLDRNGLEVFDGEFLSVHGGSLRLFCRHSQSDWRGLLSIDLHERRLQLDDPESYSYSSFAAQAQQVIDNLSGFLRGAQDRGEMVCGAGAAAKGNTLLNAASVTRQDVQFVTDTSPWKQGKYLPGSHVPVCVPEALRDYRPEYVLILAWNWAEEIMASLSFVREWGGRFVIPLPELSIV